MKQPEEDRYRVFKFLASLIIALLSVIMLGMMSSCTSEMDEPAQFPCINESITNDSFLCNNAYKPVCGCNGITYTNSCEAAYVSGVTSWTEGPCHPDVTCVEHSTDTILCTMEYNPVCGCNGITYANSCLAEAASIEDYTQGICGLVSVSICRGSSIKIGDFNANESNVYVWLTQEEGCDNCAVRTVSPQQRTHYSLHIYKPGTTEFSDSNLMDVLLFEVDVRNCTP